MIALSTEQFVIAISPVYVGFVLFLALRVIPTRDNDEQD